MIPQTTAELDETTQHRLLADEQRRFVIESLRTAGDGVETTLDELTAHLVWTAEQTGNEHVDSERDLRCRLHHVHLPMLSDAGLLEYDAEAKRVRIGSQGEVTAPVGSP